MKNKGLIIILIILLMVIIFGLIAFLYASLTGRFHFGFGSLNWGSKKSEEIIFDKNYETEEVESLEILSTAGDITFRESLDGKIRVVVYGQDEENLRVSLEANQLKVDYSEYKRKNGIFRFDFYVNDMVIYLPKDYDKEIKIKANYGDIEVIDLENASLQIEEDCGDVVLGKVKNVSVNNDYGDIEINSVLNRVNIESSCGDVKVNSVTLAENSYVKNDFGDVKIGETNDIYIDAKTDLGDVKVNQNNRHSEITLKIENDCGDIKVEN